MKNELATIWKQMATKDKMIAGMGNVIINQKQVLKAILFTELNNFATPWRNSCQEGYRKWHFEASVRTSKRVSALTPMCPIKKVTYHW